MWVGSLASTLPKASKGYGNALHIAILTCFSGSCLCAVIRWVLASLTAFPTAKLKKQKHTPGKSSPFLQLSCWHGFFQPKHWRACSPSYNPSISVTLWESLANMIRDSYVQNVRHANAAPGLWAPHTWTCRKASEVGTSWDSRCTQNKDPLLATSGGSGVRI